MLDKGDPPVNQRVWHCLQHFHPRHSSDCWILAGNACINLTCKAPYEGQGDKPRSIVLSCLMQLREINHNIEGEIAELMVVIVYSGQKKFFEL